MLMVSLQNLNQSSLCILLQFLGEFLLYWYVKRKNEILQTLLSLIVQRQRAHFLKVNYGQFGMMSIEYCDSLGRFQKKKKLK